MIEVEDPEVVKVIARTEFEVRVGGMDKDRAEEYACHLVNNALEKLKVELAGRVLH